MEQKVTAFPSEDVNEVCLWEIGLEDGEKKLRLEGKSRDARILT